MTSTKLMELLDENKKDLPDKLYLDMANLLKEKNTEEKNTEFKLVEIVYAKLKFERNYANLDSAEYTVEVRKHKKQVYVYKEAHSRIRNRLNWTPSAARIKFSNIQGKEFMFVEEDYSREVLRYLKTSEDDHGNIILCDDDSTYGMVSVDYDKYTLMTCVDV
jgi:hypothetical protein